MLYRLRLVLLRFEFRGQCPYGRHIFLNHLDGDFEYGFGTGTSEQHWVVGTSPWRSAAQSRPTEHLLASGAVHGSNGAWRLDRRLHRIFFLLGQPIRWLDRFPGDRLRILLCH